MKKFFIFILCVLFFVFSVSYLAFAKTPQDNMDTPYYKIKTSIFENMPRNEGSIVFLGDSLTDYVNFDEVFPDLRIKNRGIAGDTTNGVLNRLDEVLSLKPSKLFVLIGTNDIVFKKTSEETINNIKTIIKKFQAQSPNTIIYIQTLFPVNHNLGDKRRSHKAILAINDGLKKLSEEMNIILIDTYSLFEENGELPKRYTVDGVHLNGAGILHWMNFLRTWLQDK